MNILKGSLISFLSNKELTKKEYRALHLILAIIFLSIQLILILCFQIEAVRNSLVDYPFHKDYNYIVILTITIPAMVTFSLQLRWNIIRTILDLKEKKIIELAIGFKEYSDGFQKKVILGNTLSLVIGIFFAILNVWNNVSTFTSTNTTDFQSLGTGSIVPSGYWYMFCIFILTLLFFQVLGFFTLQILYLMGLLKKNIMIVTGRILHPDKRGGLKSIVGIGRLNQLIVSMFGLNLGIMLVQFSMNGAGGASGTLQLNFYLVGAITFYIISGPIFFFAPLWLFKRAIMEVKEKALDRISMHYDVEVKDIVDKRISRVQDVDIHKLEKYKYIYNDVDKMPVWPFDSDALKDFIFRYILPAVPGVISWVTKVYVK